MIMYCVGSENGLADRQQVHVPMSNAVVGRSQDIEKEGLNIDKVKEPEDIHIDGEDCTSRTSPKDVDS